MGSIKGLEWSEEDLSILRRLWVEPVTAAYIGTQLTLKRGKNAVVGQAHRMVLGAKMPAPKKKTKHRGRSIQVRGPRKAAPKPLEVVKIVKTVEPPPVKATPPALTFRPFVLVSPEALDRRMCRWPYGDPAKPEFGYCGCHTEGVYCLVHRGIAYRAAEERKNLKPTKLYPKRRA